MDQNSMESDENATDHLDDGNLLEPLGEVSFSEREKSFESVTLKSTPKSNIIAKDPDVSLPDARARLLQLQRVQRDGGSSGSSGTKKRSSKSHSGDKDIEKEEQTVSLSLDSLIRRGVMNNINRAANFKSNFKFGKPDDDISLRVNPSANLFYEHSNEPYSDSESEDTYESSGERDATEEPKFGVTSNGSITNGNGNGLEEHSASVKRKRGRPPLTEEEKSERAAHKEALRLQNRSIQSQVDEFSMAMGHSIFHTSSPNKRGRPPKSRYATFLNSTAPSDSQNESSQLDESVNEPVVGEKKKRGRKPKSYYLEMAAHENESGASINEQNGTDVTNVSNKQSNFDEIMTLSNSAEKSEYMKEYVLNLKESAAGGIIKKKRGRKPKNYYLQQMMERANESAPAIMEDVDKMEQDEQDEQSDVKSTIANRSIDLSIYANKRGRRPKAYYEQLASLERQGHNTDRPNELTTTTVLNASIPSNEPPVKKKRGRKPKSYYLNLQLEQQQAAENQSTSQFQAQSTNTGDSISSQGRLSTEYDGHVESATASNLLTTKSLPPHKSQIKTIVHRPYVRRIIPQQKIFRRPGHDIPLVGLPFKKKRGRKPKNYQPHLDEQLIELNNSILRPIESSAQSHSLQALLDLYEKRGDEIRILKQRMSNLINDKIEQSVDMNTVSWTNIELCKAFSLQRLNIPLFNYLREKFSIPMPSTEDVRQFVRNLKLTRGLQNTMLQMLDCDGQHYQEHEKITILQISYIKTTDIYEYDEHLDLILGPHKFLTLIVARGLYKDWSQVVYFNFDTRVAKPQLNSAIEALHKIDYSVVALASNFEEGKSDLFSDLSINCGKGFIQHPITQEKIHCFYYLDDMLQATNAHFFGGQLTIDDSQQTKQPINKQAVMQAIHKNYRRIPIPRELLAWTDNDINNVEAIHTFFSQFTINLMRISMPDDRATKNVTEFISIMKSYSELMSRSQTIDSDADTINFDRYMEYQNKRLDKIHARLFKLDHVNSSETARKKFREAMMMSIVSLKMLRKSVMTKFKNSTFSTEAITKEITRTKMNELITKYNFKRVMPPSQLCRIIKDIFLGENCSIKTESNVKFFYSGPLTAAEINGRNESYYVAALIQWICDTYTKQYPDSMDIKDLKRKFKKIEETFCTIQNPNFCIYENVINKIKNDLIESNAFEPSFNEFIRLYIIQRHLLRIKYFNENHITRIALPVQMTINLEE